MKPKDFIAYVRGIAEENNFALEKIIFGGDHLGPSVWQDEPAETAMRKSLALVRDYVQAGFTKIHLDASMRLADDPPDILEPEIIARRTAQMAETAETTAVDPFQLRYVIGTEVPLPGGAQEHEESLSVTTVESTRQTIEVTREAFIRQGLESAWERVIAIVVQPGVEFGDDFVLEYRPDAAQRLSKFIEGQPMVFEAHSTDYQSQAALGNLVRDHFAILKVGPALTFAFREAVFALAIMENELFPLAVRSNIIQVLDEAMQRHPAHWRKYYNGTPELLAFKRKFSLSDRIRYYWPDPLVQNSLKNLLVNLAQTHLPEALLSQYVPDALAMVRNDTMENLPEQILLWKVRKVLEQYYIASGG